MSFGHGSYSGYGGLRKGSFGSLGIDLTISDEQFNRLNTDAQSLFTTIKTTVTPGIEQIGNVAYQVEQLIDANDQESAFNAIKSLGCGSLGMIHPGLTVLCESVLAALNAIVTGIVDLWPAHAIYDYEIIRNVVAQRLGYGTSATGLRNMADDGWVYTWRHVNRAGTANFDPAGCVAWSNPFHKLWAELLMDIQLSDVPFAAGDPYRRRCVQLIQRIEDKIKRRIDESEDLDELIMLSPGAKNRWRRLVESGAVFSTTSFGGSCGIAFIYFNVDKIPLDMCHDLLAASTLTVEEQKTIPRWLTMLQPSRGPYRDHLNIALEHMARRLHKASVASSKGGAKGATKPKKKDTGKVIAAAAGVGLVGALLYAALA